MFSGNAMHGNGIVGNYVAGYRSTYDRLISGLKNRDLSYFAILKALLCILDQAAESVERTQSFVGKVGAGTSVNAVHLALSQKRLLSSIESIVAIIESSTEDAHKEKRAIQFLKRRGDALIMQCLQALSHLDQSRHAINPFAEQSPDIVCHVSDAVTKLVDAIATLSRANAYVTTGKVEESAATTDTKRRIVRYINTACCAISSMSDTSISQLVTESNGRCTESEIRTMAYHLLVEAASISSLIRDEEKETNRKSALHAFSTAASILQRMVRHLVPDSTDTQLCKIVQISIERAFEEHERNAAGVCINDDVFGSGCNLSIMLLEAVSTMHAVHTSFNTTPTVIEGDIENCKRTILGVGEKLQAALSVLRGRSLTDVKSLGDANVFSHITGILADAQSLLEAIDVRLFPNPTLHGELLNNVRKTLCEAAAICIKQQCAGNPEYSVPTELDCANPRAWGFPSTKFAAVATSLVGDFIGCRIM
ncbi:hypothetical protein [Anaplasma phagocytophilum]|uniref:Uncharacterized protein n=2 Tax=Anaplasma phagocytophilum str. CRT38 TaxID=1269275 RepID=S6G815_ANAPH|nr:hypothetical protein [Anaplasma phagocytophilum]EOA62299.1 hypothetical protein CRT38_03497 [Anaplasma phagocytophilum str. CRT38]